MFRIVYVSTAVAAFLEEELRHLLRVARLNNEASGVTGMLVYSRGQFLQALEGEPRPVISTFDRISADVRHAELKTLQRGKHAGQWFANWSMGFHSVHQATTHVSVSDRINLGALDEFSAVDFLRSCSRSQTL
jgi:hypothetical protein